MRTATLRQLKAAPEMQALSDGALERKADEIVAEQAKELLSPWLRRFLAMDPRENLAHVTCPVLALNGEKDLQVPAEANLSRIRQALEGAGNKDVTIRALPGLNHLFQTCRTGSPSEYAGIEETFSPVALEAVTSWIRKQGGLE